MNIKTYQIALNSFGYLESSFITGEYNLETEKAVRAFQKDHELEVTGVLNNDTMVAIDKKILESENPDGEEGEVGELEEWKLGANNPDAFFSQDRGAGKNGSTITIIYGGYRTRVISDVVFRSVGETISPEGDAIYKQYEFIAKDVEGDI